MWEEQITITQEHSGIKKLPAVCIYENSVVSVGNTSFKTLMQENENLTTSSKDDWSGSESHESILYGQFRQNWSSDICLCFFKDVWYNLC